MHEYAKNHSFFKILFRFIFKIIKYCIFTFILVIFILGAFASLKIPLLNRNWSEESQILPSVTFSTSTVTIKNIRDWRYSSTTPIAKDYYDETFDLKKLDKVYFVLSTFGPWVGIAHTFFVFEFSDDKAVAFSIEARREKGVPYSTIKGLFNNYEKWYAWGSPADFLSRRAVYFNDPVYMYELNISTSTASSIFLDVANTTHILETKAMFYNTIFSNCTNELADAANRVNKGSVPLTLASVFPGFADDKLYDLKLIAHDKPFEEIMNEANVKEKIREFHQTHYEIYSGEEFWNIFK